MTSKKIHLIVFAAALLAGFASFTPLENYEVPLDSSPEFCGPSEIIPEERDINRYEPMEEERWSSYTNEKVPDYKQYMNSYAVRNEEFPLEKPQGEYRIAVFGASRSGGYGVNNSDTYHQILEHQLDERTSQDIRVINAYHGRYGMKDRYQFLLNDGLKFEPDLVLIPFTKAAEISHQEHNNITRQVKEDYNVSQDAEIRDHPEAFDALGPRVSKYKQSKLSNWRNSSIRKYGNLITLLGEKEGFEVVFYWLEPEFDQFQREGYSSVEVGNENYESPLIAMREVCGAEIMTSPEKFQRNIEEYRYVPDIYPYNKKGHRLIAEDLTEKLAPFVTK